MGTILCDIQMPFNRFAREHRFTEKPLGTPIKKICSKLLVAQRNVTYALTKNWYFLDQK